MTDPIVVHHRKLREFRIVEREISLGNHVGKSRIFTSGQIYYRLLGRYQKNLMETDNTHRKHTTADLSVNRSSNQT